MYQNYANRVLTGEVRLSYAHLTQPRSSRPNEAPKYSVTLLIPKTDVATVNEIHSAIKAAYETGVTGKWAGKHPIMKEILHDGDGVRQSGQPFGDECKGHWVITASKQAANGAPFLCSIEDRNSVIAPTEIYSGIYARVTLEFYPYDRPDSKGVACGLRGVMKTRDGEPLCGTVVTSSEFDEPGVGAQPNYAAPAAPAYQAPVAPAYPQAAAPQQYAQPAAPQQGGVRINPITGQPM